MPVHGPTFEEMLHPSTISPEIRRRARITLLASLALSALAGRPALAQHGADAAPFDSAARDALRSKIRRTLDSAGVASVAIAVARDGVILWEEGFGYADLAAKRPATPATPYAIASISKPMTATAVLRLAEEGRLALDRPLDDYLGRRRLTSLGGDRADATVARVLSHTSGLPLHYQFFYENRPTRPDVSRAIARYGRVMFPPGEVYSYSNLGYGLLGEAITHASGIPYEQYMHEQVFAPLGMTRTTIGTGAGIEDAAVRYGSAHDVVPHYDFDHRGASAVYASAHDLARFGMFHLKTRPRQRGAAWSPPLRDSTIDRMQRVATPADASAGYGLGCVMDREFGVRRVRHTGSMPGVSAVLALYPDERVAIVVLSNQYSPVPGRLATELAAAVLPAPFADSLRARSLARAAVAPPFAAPAAMRGEWRGSVRTHEGTLPLALRIDSSAVRVRLGGARAPWLPLRAPSARGRLIGGRFEGTIPTVDARTAPHVIGLSLQLAGGTLRGWAAAYVEAESDDFALSSYAELRRVPTAAGSREK